LRLEGGRTLSAPLLVLAIVLLGSAAFAESETEDQTQTATRSQGQGLQFALTPVPVQGHPSYAEGNGSGSLQVQGTTVYVHAQASEMARGAHFSLALTANGSAHWVANMTTNDDGELEAESAVSLPAGAYSLGLQVYDTSTFSGPTLVLSSTPSALTASLGGSAGGNSTGGEGQPVRTIQGGSTEDDDIRNAIHSSFIPAVVQVGGSGSTVSVTDERFSVSVGQYQQDGFLISISGANITGPRAILVNLTSAAATDLLSGKLFVSLDGSQVQQASSFSQVINATQSDPSRFIISSGASGVKFLISIPHFSSHTIEILPILTQALTSLVTDVPLLLFSVAALTAVVFVYYDRRLRVGAGPAD